MSSKLSYNLLKYEFPKETDQIRSKKKTESLLMTCTISSFMFEEDWGEKRESLIALWALSGGDLNCCVRSGLPRVF